MNELDEGGALPRRFDNLRALFTAPARVPAAGSRGPGSAGPAVPLRAKAAVARIGPCDPDFIVLADPEGNRFCVVNTGHGHE
jgi:hypothetical protein